MLKKRALIIDDEIDFCLLLRKYFIMKNYEVFVSHTLQEGLLLLKTFDPDIVFLDNNLPDGLGWEETAYIVENHAHSQLHLITGYNPHNSSLSTKFPSVKFWEKPLNTGELNTYLSSSTQSFMFD